MECISHAARWWSYITRAVVLGAILVMPTQALAVVVYDFSGQCTDVNDVPGCPGDIITGVLTLTDAYIPGDPIAETSASPDVFMSFEFTVPGFPTLMLDTSDYAASVSSASDLEIVS